MFLENQPTTLQNKRILDSLIGLRCEVSAIGNIKDNCKYPLKVIGAAQNKKQTKTGGLTRLLDLKVGA